MGINIVTCPQWNARKPRNSPRIIGAAPGIMIHHTAGHHREIANPDNQSEAESERYARDIQAYHMDHNGWIDSGHNFLVCRNGVVLQGRWLTVSAIQAGRMVESAHCPGFNTWVGIEHEHKGQEKPTTEQLEATAVLQAWIAYQYGRKLVLPITYHGAHYATSCPANLVEYIPAIRKEAQRCLTRQLF